MKQELYFELTNETKVNIFGITLFRIKATKSFRDVRVGDLGGWVDTAHLRNGNARVSGNANIEKDNDICWFSKFGSSNRTSTFYRTKEKNVIKVSCGCFHGTLKQFIDKVKETHGDNKFAKEYKAMVAGYGFRRVEVSGWSTNRDR